MILLLSKFCYHCTSGDKEFILQTTTDITSTPMTTRLLKRSSRRICVVKQSGVGSIYSTSTNSYPHKYCCLPFSVLWLTKHNYSILFRREATAMHMKEDGNSELDRQFLEDQLESFCYYLLLN